jgi:hypothetical protein
MAACVSALGVDDERESAVAALCQCITGGGKAFNDVDDCQRTLNGRLDGSSAGTRAAWLKNFSTQGCDRCKNFAGAQEIAVACLRLAPTCSLNPESCVSLPCCSGSCSNPGKVCE